MAASGVFVDLHTTMLAAAAAGTASYGGAITSWAVGEGGYLTVGASKIPKAPDPTLTDTEASIPPATIATSATGLRFAGVFGVGDVVAAGSLITATITLNAVEAGLDNNSKLTGNAGNPPQLFEVMLFDAAGDAVAYCTYDQVVKVVGTPVTLTLTLTY